MPFGENIEKKAPKKEVKAPKKRSIVSEKKKYSLRKKEKSPKKRSIDSEKEWKKNLPAVGFEPTKHMQQILSLSPLTAREYW